MKKSKKIKDERILMTKRKIQSDAFQIIWIVLVISVLVQQYLYAVPFEQYVVELLIFIAMSLYIIVANIIAGNDLFDSTKSFTPIVINSLVSGVIVTIVITTSNYLNNGFEWSNPILTMLIVAGATFAINTPIIFAVFYVLYLFNQKRQEKIEKKLAEDDDIDA